VPLGAVRLGEHYLQPVGQFEDEGVVGGGEAVESRTIEAARS
jgi:hypothetical protein